jgi:GTP cyclohydrolase I
MRPASELQALEIQDVQSGVDTRGVAIDEVGIEELAYPITVFGRDGADQRTVAQVAMAVQLAHHVRGVHMSRFVEILHEFADEIDESRFLEMALETRSRLDSDTAQIRLRFPYFLERSAPVSSMSSMMEYGCSLTARSDADATELAVGVRVPITSLCPCSKEISDYGAHNQRGYVEIEASSPWRAGEASGIWLEDLIDVAEAAGSAPIFPLLKRTDERELTMRAYDNPAFVEDIVRDVAVALRDDVRVARFSVRVSNQESIHNHSAVAQVSGSRGGDG